MGAGYKGSRLEMVTNLLRDCGPMTAERIGEELDIPTELITVTIQAARARRPGQSFRIVRYVSQIGRWSPAHCVWSASSGQDAERPPYDRAARVSEWEARRRERHGESRRARMAIYNAARRGRPVVANPYLQLVPVTSRGYVAAAASSQMKRAA